MPAATTHVTEIPDKLKEVLGAAAREEVYIRNQSGSGVLLFLDGATLPFEELGSVEPGLYRISITGAEASLAIHAKCPLAPLSLWVTAIS